MFYRYMELKAELLQEIAMGIFPEGAVLPPERELARMYYISRVSVRRALQDLLNEGILAKTSNNRTCVKVIPGRTGVRQLVFIGKRPLSLLPELYRRYYEALLVKSFFFGCQMHYYDLSSKGYKGDVRFFDAGFYAGSDALDLPLPFKVGQLIRLDGKGCSGSVSTVATDNFAGGFMAAEHFHACGIRNAAMFVHDDTGFSENITFRERTEGFLAGCRQFGMKSHGIFAANSTYKSVFAALQGKTGVSGIQGLFVLYDYLAMNVMHALHAMEIRIPKDMSVIGYDGHSFGAFMLPPLTTIAQNVNGIITHAFDIALGQKPSGCEVLVKPSLVLRSSTSGNVKGNMKK